MAATESTTSPWARVRTLFRAKPPLHDPVEDYTFDIKKDGKILLKDPFGFVINHPLKAIVYSVAIKIAAFILSFFSLFLGWTLLGFSLNIERIIFIHHNKFFAKIPFANIIHDWFIYFAQSMLQAPAEPLSRTRKPQIQTES
jgi:hypothetical protein